MSALFWPSPSSPGQYADSYCLAWCCRESPSRASPEFSGARMWSQAMVIPLHLHPPQFPLCERRSCEHLHAWFLLSRAALTLPATRALRLHAAHRQPQPPASSHPGTMCPSYRSSPLREQPASLGSLQSLKRVLLYNISKILEFGALSVPQGWVLLHCCGVAYTMPRWLRFLPSVVLPSLCLASRTF